MPKCYCRQCANPTIFETLSPKYCAFCSAPFDGATKPSPVLTKKKTVAIIVEDSDEEESEAELIAPEKIEMEFIRSRPNSVMWEDLAQQAPDPNFQGRQTPKLSKKARAAKRQEIKTHLQSRGGQEID